MCVLKYAKAYRGSYKYKCCLWYMKANACQACCSDFMISNYVLIWMLPQLRNVFHTNCISMPSRLSLWVSFPIARVTVTIQTGRVSHLIVCPFRGRQRCSRGLNGFISCLCPCFFSNIGPKPHRPRTQIACRNNLAEIVKSMKYIVNNTSLFLWRRIFSLFVDPH